MRQYRILPQSVFVGVRRTHSPNRVSVVLENIYIRPRGKWKYQGYFVLMLWGVLAKMDVKFFKQQ